MYFVLLIKGNTLPVSKRKYYIHDCSSKKKILVNFGIILSNFCFYYLFSSLVDNCVFYQQNRCKVNEKTANMPQKWRKKHFFCIFFAKYLVGCGLCPLTLRHICTFGRRLVSKVNFDPIPPKLRPQIVVYNPILA